MAVGSACRRAAGYLLATALAQAVTAFGDACQRGVDAPQLVRIAVDLREVEVDDQVGERIVLDVASLLRDAHVRFVG